MEKKKNLRHDPAISLLGMYPEKTTIRKDTCTPMFTATIFTIAKTREQPKCPTEEWIKKIWYMYHCVYVVYVAHVHNGIVLNHKTV